MRLFFTDKLTQLAANFSGSTTAIRALFLLLFVDLIWASSTGITLHNLDVGLTVAVLPLIIAMMIDATGYAKRVAHIAHDLALWWVSLLLFRVFTYLCAAVSFPLMDTYFSNIDIALGFNWVAWSRYVANHFYLNNFLDAVYESPLYQIYFAVLFFSHSKRRLGAHELWFTTVISLLITLMVSAVLPALGAFYYYKENLEAAIGVSDFLALRAGTLNTFDVLHLGGIVTFPSFHMVLACLLCCPYRHYKKIFPAILLLNFLMMLSIPSHGGHYLVDMMGGLVVAFVSIILYHKLMQFKSLIFDRQAGASLVASNT